MAIYLSGVQVLMFSILRKCSTCSYHSLKEGVSVDRHLRGITRQAATRMYLINYFFIEGMEPGRIERRATCGVLVNVIVVTIS